MKKTSRRWIRHAVEAVLLCAAAAGWIYLAVNAHRQKDPVAIVQQHFMFYPSIRTGSGVMGRARKQHPGRHRPHKVAGT